MLLWRAAAPSGVARLSIHRTSWRSGDKCTKFSACSHILFKLLLLRKIPTGTTRRISCNQANVRREPCPVNREFVREDAGRPPHKSSTKSKGVDAVDSLASIFIRRSSQSHRRWWTDRRAAYEFGAGCRGFVAFALAHQAAAARSHHWLHKHPPSSWSTR